MKLVFDAADLRPLVEEIVRQTLAAIKPTDNDDDSRISYTEKEAAELLGLERHVLREQRRLGRIECCIAKPGRRILYRREQIEKFLDGDNNNV